MISPLFVDHLVFRVANLKRTEHFYAFLIGPPAHKDEENLLFLAGQTRLFFTKSSVSPHQKFDKEAVGLNHLAFGVRSLQKLKVVEEELDSAGLRHSGILLDHYGQKEFIWLDDPDGMRVEFYIR